MDTVVFEDRTTMEMDAEKRVSEYQASEANDVEEYGIVERAIQYLEEHYLRQPTLKEVADHVGLSEYHFQRIFTQRAGISPKRFLQFLTKEHARELLERSESLLEVAYASGLSGTGRLHDLFVTMEAVTPGEVKRRGAGLVIEYGFHPSPFGECLLAVTERGLCNLMFVQNGDRQAVVEELHQRWPDATLTERPEATADYARRIFHPLGKGEEAPLPVFLKGTNFQIQVWEALLRVPSGCLVTYEDLARQAGSPKAVRAVGNAVASNPIAYLIPCHRVIRKMGEIGGYHYGSARKRLLLARELGEGNDLEVQYS